MSKPSGSTKPRASEPVRLPSNPPPNARKANNGPNNGGASRTPSKFYDGPTVQKNAVDAKEQVKAVAGKTVAVAQAKTRQAVRVARRHPWSIASLITTVPFLLFISLFSTVLCPPPETQPSSISRFVQTRLGIYDGPSELRQTLCYPANQYHQEVLVPYIYPAIDDIRSRAESSVAYSKILHPSYISARNTGEKYWKHPIQPIVKKISIAIRRVYLTTVEPHLPWVRTKWYTLTAPISDRVKAAHQQYLAPHISTANNYARLGHGKALSGYRYTAAHPLTALLGRHAQTGYRMGSKRSQEAYTWSRPHAIRIGKEAERYTREVVVPKATAVLKWIVDHVEEGFHIAKAQIATQYNIHLNPHLHPYTSKASATISPYTQLFLQKVYNPYLREYVHYILPASLLAPEPPKSFWTIISDFLPTPGSNAAQRKGSMSEEVRKETASAKSAVKGGASSASASVASVKQQAAKASALAKEKAASLSAVAAKSASSAAAAASRSASSVSVAAKEQVTSVTSAGQAIAEEATASVKSASASVASAAGSAASSASVAADDKGKMTKAEFEARRDVLKARLKVQGDNSIEALKRELIAVQTRFHENTYPKMAENNRKELQKDVDYILSGLDKLYSESEALTKNQVKQSGVMAEQRLQNKLTTIKARGGEVARVTKDQGKPALRKEMDAVDEVLGKEWTDLAMKIAWIDGITASDRKTFNGLRKTADEYKTRLAAIHEGKEVDKSIQAAESRLSVAIKELSTELDDLYAGFRERVKVLQTSANDKVAARDMVRGSQAAAEAARASAKPVKEGQATILPIIPGAAAAEVPVNENDFIGKGKEQVIQALSQASAAIRGETPTKGVVEQVSASASSVYEAASSAVHNATRSVVRAAGGTPVPETPGEHVESVIGQVQDAAASAYDAASSVVHDATRSAIRAVGATPSPETPAEHVQCVVEAAKDSASSAASVAGSAVSQATRSVKSAVGVSTTPENLQESAESVYSVVSETAASVATAAGNSAHDATEAIKSALSSLHLATESIKSANPNPLPTANEYLASIANDVAAGAASVYGIVEENVHQATRSVISLVGATPSPESPMEYAQSYAGEISKTAESLASVASASLASLASVASASASSAGLDVGDVGASAVSAQSVVASAVHAGTRSIIKAAGATPSPEGAQEHFDAYAAAAADNLAKILSDVSASVSSVSEVASSAVHHGTRSIVRAAGGTPNPETPQETLESVMSVASASASSVFDSATSIGGEAINQVSVLADSIQSALGLKDTATKSTPVPTNLASSASAYLASISTAGASVGNEAISSGSSILASLQSQAVKVVGRDEL